MSCTTLTISDHLTPRGGYFSLQTAILKPLFSSMLSQMHLTSGKRQNKGKMTSREKHHALGKLAASPNEHKRPDLETDVLILLLHSLYCVMKEKEAFHLGCNTPLFMIWGTVDQKDSNPLLIPFP